MQRRHDPTYYWATRRLPAEIRPATHALYGYVRTADEIVDGPRRPPAPRRAAPRSTPGSASSSAGLAAGRSPHPVVGALVDAGRRHRLRSASCGTYMRSMRIDCAPVRIESWQELEAYMDGSAGLGRADHGAAARRARAPPRRLRPARPRVPARRTSSATCARTPRSTASTCRREDRARFGVGEEDLRAPQRVARAARAARARGAPRALAVRRGRAGGRRRARLGPHAACGFAVAVYLRVLDRVERIDFDVLGRAHRRARRGSCRARRSGRCAGDAPGDPARRRAHAAGRRRRARRRARLRRQLRRARGRARARRQRRRRARRRPLRDRRARRRRPARRRRRGCRRWACATRSARSCRAWRSTRRTARRASGCRGAGRRSTTGRSARSCGRSARRALRGRQGRAPRAATSSRPTAATLTAPLIVDALGWRRVLGAGPNVQPPEAQISRGLEVHPGRARRRHRPRRLDRPLADPLRLRLVGPGGRRAARRRRLLRAARPRQGADAARSPAGSASPPVRYQGNWFPHALRPAAEDGVFFAGDSAGHCFPLSGEGIRTAFYFGIACGRELRRVLAGEATRERGARRLRRVLRRATRRRSRSRCGCSG